MLILALETATRAGSLALVGSGARHAMTGDPSRTHGVRLPQELFDFVAEQGRSVAELDYLCAVSGPGSFTGLRIGLATLQGVAMTGGKPVIPIPTLDAMAAAWSDQHPGEPATLMTCLDGARGDVFFSVFGCPGDSSASPDAMMPTSVAPPSEAAARVAALGLESALTIIGDGAVRYRDTMTVTLPSATVEDRPLNLALGAALLAMNRSVEAVSPHALRPLYVRRPDAVLARDRARAANQPPALSVTRATTAEDLQAIAELQRRSFANAWGAEAIRWELDNSTVARMYAGRTPEGVVIAYCSCWVVFDELHINSLAVDQGWRQRRVARTLLENVLADAVNAGARSATLEVRQSNDAARALYEGLGFRVEGVRRGYYQDPKEDALILWHRHLPAHFGPG